MLYWKNNNISNLVLEGCYIYKREDEDGGAGLQAQKGKINTFGSFAKYELSPWTFRGQFAYQFGDYGNNDRRAFGGYAFVDRNFKDYVWSPQATLGFFYLSGDKQGSNKDEAWDPLFSRWGWISDLYVLSMLSETGILV